MSVFAFYYFFLLVKKKKKEAGDVSFFLFRSNV